MNDERETEPVARLVGRLVETICRFIRQEIGGAVRTTLRDARSSVAALAVGAALCMLGAVFVFVGILRLLMLSLDPWAAYLVVGGLALLGACAVFLGMKGRSGDEARGDEAGDA
ncbi:MAG: phage holin family protein [Armatimonadota bacterium]